MCSLSKNICNMPFHPLPNSINSDKDVIILCKLLAISGQSGFICLDRRLITLDKRLPFFQTKHPRLNFPQRNKNSRFYSFMLDLCCPFAFYLT